MSNPENPEGTPVESGPKTRMLADDFSLLNAEGPEANSPIHTMVQLIDYPAELEGRRKNLEENPTCALAHVVMGLGLLRMGDYINGWREYSWVCHLIGETTGKPKSQGHGLTGPVWDGVSSLRNKKIMLVNEEGLGDFIQFLRYTTLLKKRYPGIHITLKPPPPLTRLFARHLSVDKVIAYGDLFSNRSYDYWTSICRLPHALQCTDLSPTDPYIVPCLSHVNRWKPALDARCAGLRVALVWGGSTLHDEDEARSTHFSELSPLLDIPGITFVSLQRDDRKYEAREYWGQSNFIDLGSYIESFEDTAAILSCVDLLVSVDSSPVHLAGAMGTETWVLLAPRPDWRWGVAGSTTQLYTNMSLIRQKTANWATIADQIKAKLLKKLSSRDLL